MPFFFQSCRRLALLVVILVAVGSRAEAQVTDPLLPGRLRQYVEQNRAKLGPAASLSLAVSSVVDGKEIFAVDSGTALMPASVLKIVTSVAALRFLGANYQFPTEIFVDALPKDFDPRLDPSVGFGSARSGGSTGSLYIRGYGDPTFRSEDLLLIATELRLRGISSVENIVIDDSLFKSPAAASGPRPYQAAASATSVNHNCYQLVVSPAGSGQPAIVGLTPGLSYEVENKVKTLSTKGESIDIVQTPTSETFNPEVRGPAVGQFFQVPMNPLKVRLQGRVNLASEAQPRYLTVRDPVAHYAELVRYYLGVAQIRVSGSILRGETPASAKLAYLHRSRPLANILWDLNHYSSNFIANQIVYALGQDSVGFFRRELGLQRVASVLEGIGFKAGEFAIVDGSGLERGNKLSTAQLVLLLQQAYQDFSLAPDLLSSLSRFGVSGTLIDRKLLEELPKPLATTNTYQKERQRADGVWAKTGTLDTVSSLAGYLETRTGDRVAFAVIINGQVSKDAAVEFEDSLIKVLLDLG